MSFSFSAAEAGGGKIDHCLLARVGQAELDVGVVDQQLSKEEPFCCFSRQLLSHAA